MSKISIYHNPRCSKSREALQLLVERGIEPQVINYLETPLTQKQIKELLAMLNVEVFDIIRTNEAEFKKLGLDKTSSKNDLIKAIKDHPILLQRPIIVHNNKAVIGRPVEKIFEIL
jgi:arsenate reductase